MIYSAYLNGYLDIKPAINESLLSIKRAGADLILSYFAKEYLSC
jgi:porphobilinogen synthase